MLLPLAVRLLESGLKVRTYAKQLLSRALQHTGVN